MAIDLLGGSVELLVESRGNLVPIESTIGLGPGVHFIDSIRVTMGLFRILDIEVNLNPPIDIALKLLRSGNLGLGFSVAKPGASIQAGGSNPELAQKASGVSVVMNKIALRLHYGGMTSRWFKGLLLQPEIDIGAEGITIQLKAVGMLFEAAKTYATKSFDENANAAATVKELLGDQVELDIDPEAKAALNSPIGPGVTSTKNNFETAKNILQRKHCKMVLAGSNNLKKQRVRIFTSNDERNKPRAVAEFVAYRQINPALRQFPLLSFSAPIQNLLIGPWGGMRLGFVKKDDKSKAHYDADAADMAKTRSKVFTPDKTTGGGAVQAKVDATGDAGGIARSDQTGRQIPVPYRSQINNAIDDVREVVHDFVDHVFEYDVTSVMVPDLLPGDVAQVAISDIAELSGTYGIMEVTHSLSGSGAETQMRLYRTAGLVQASSAGIEKAKAKVASTVSGKPVSSSGSGVIQ